MWSATADHRASQRVVMVGVNDANDAGASDVDVDVDDGFEVLALGLGARKPQANAAWRSARLGLFRWRVHSSRCKTTTTKD